MARIFRSKTGHPRSSNRTCPIKASGSPTGFTERQPRKPLKLITCFHKALQCRGAAAPRDVENLGFLRPPPALVGRTDRVGSKSFRTNVDKGRQWVGIAAMDHRSLILLASVIAFAVAGTSALAEDGVTKDRIVFGQVAALEGPAQALG